MPAVVLFAFLQTTVCQGEAAVHLAEAKRRGDAFDLNGAATAYAAAVRAGCESARAPVIYLRGLIAARAADAQFGSAASMQPLQQAITDLEPFAVVDSVARAMQMVLRAGIPAAEHERAAMALFIEEMLRLESLQLEARLPPLPVLSAHEVAGYFWLQLHVYDEAGRAFDLAARSVGQTPHIILGMARVAAGRGDRGGACELYRRLLVSWNNRPGSPPEIAEAQAFLKQPPCVAPAKPVPAR